MEERAEQMVGYLVWRLSTSWRTEMERVLAPLGMTHAQYALLASLYGMSRSGRQPSQRELADWTGLEAIYVSKLARALERSELLIRTEHPKDPRAVQLTLTPLGSERVEAAFPIVQALLDQLTGPIGGLHSPGNRSFAHTLRTLLDREERNSAMATPPLTGQDLGEAEGAGAAALLADMESRGLVKDNALTDTGAARNEELTALVTPMSRRMFEGIDPDDLATARRVLNQITARARQLREEKSGEPGIS